MKVNLDKVSKRAKGFFENPQFLRADLLEDFEVTTDSSDKILTVFHRGNADEMELIFSEALAIFSRNRTQNDLWRINFREFENFLRDENHHPAFDESITGLEERLTKIKIMMIASMTRARLKLTLTNLTSAISHWKSLDLVAKNIWANNLLKALEWELIFCDGETLTVTKSPAGLENDSLEFLFLKILGREESGLPMKVVAVQ